MGVLGINHIAFRTPDPTSLRAFYARLLDAEELSGEHDPLRAGGVLLVFFRSDNGGAGSDPDEIAFDVDAAGFDAALKRANEMGLALRGPWNQSAHSRGFYLRDPDGRRIEITHQDHSIYWQE